MLVSDRTKVLVIVFLLFGIDMAFAGFVIDGDTVYVNDSSVYISATPHTVYSSGWVYINLTSKVYTGDIDLVFGFDTEIARPSRAELYKPHNITWNESNSMFFNAVSSINISTEPCIIGNEYNSIKRNVTYTPENASEESTIVCFDSYEQTGNDYLVTWHTEYSMERQWKDYTDTFNSINYNYSGMNKWYYIRNIPIIANNSYLARGYVKVPVSLEQQGGKYWIALKPSSESISEAIANGHFYALDPYWNETYGNRKEIQVGSISTTLYNYTLLFNVSYESSMETDFRDIRFTCENDTGTEVETSYYIENKADSSYSDVWVMIPKVSTSNTTCYMYYNNSNVVDASNPNTTFLFYDDFEDGSYTNDWNAYVNGGGAGSVTETGGQMQITHTGSAGSWYSRWVVTKKNWTLPLEMTWEQVGHLPDYPTGHMEVGYLSHHKEANTLIWSIDGVFFRAYQFDDTNDEHTCAGWNNGTVYYLNCSDVANDFWWNSRVIRMQINITHGRWLINETLFTDWIRVNKTGNYLSSQEYHVWLEHRAKGVSGSDVSNFSWVRLRRVWNPEPTYSLGTEETSGVVITVYSPLNATYYHRNISLEVSANKVIDTWWYKLNSLYDDASLRIYYTFDEINGTSVYDNSTFGNNGTISGATIVSSGKFGGGMLVDANDERVLVPDSNSLDVSSAVSISFWLNWTGGNANYRILDKGFEGGDKGYLAQLQSDNKLYFYVSSDGTAETSVVTTDAVAQNEWVHFVLIYNGNNLSIYKNGVLASTEVSYTSDINTNSIDLKIGAWSSSGAFGKYDEFMIFSRALTVDEISELYEDNVHGVAVVFAPNATFMADNGFNSLAVWANTSESDRDVENVYFTVALQPIQVYQYATIEAYDNWTINWTLYVVAVNNGTIDLWNITVDIDDEFSASAYVIPSLLAGGFNITSYASNWTRGNISAGEGDVTIDVDEVVLSIGAGGESDNLTLINPVDPPDKVSYYISLTLNYSSVSFGSVSHGFANNSADNTYQVDVNTNCNANLVFNALYVPLTFSSWTIPNNNVKLNYTKNVQDYPSLLTLDSNRTVGVADNDIVYPYYYLDVPQGQHSGNYYGNHTVEGSC